MNLGSAIYKHQSPAFNNGKPVIVYHPRGLPPTGITAENTPTPEEVAMVTPRARGSKVRHFDATTGDLVHEFPVIG